MPKFLAKMTTSHRVIVATIAILIVLLVAAVSVPNQELRRILLAAVLAAALVLLAAYFFLVTAELARQEDMIELHAALIAESRTEIRALRRQLHTHLATSAARQLDRHMDVDEALRALVQPRAKEG